MHADLIIHIMNSFKDTFEFLYFLLAPGYIFVSSLNS